MKPDFFKKLPLLRNVDFDNPDTRRGLMKASVAVLGIIGVLLLSLGGDNAGEAEQQQQEQERTVSTMEIPGGEDNDILKSETTMDARVMSDRMNGRRTYGDIYDNNDVNADEDPMAGVHGAGRDTAVIREHKADTQRKASQERTDTGERTRTSSASEKKTAGRSHSSGGGGATAVSPQEAAARRAAERKRQMMMEAGLLDENGNRTYNPNDALLGTSAHQDTPAHQAAQQEPSVPEKKEEKVAGNDAAAAQQRPSGDIRAASSRGNISSLKDRNRQASSDSERLIRVMFPTTEKVVSGQRVSLRLLEDMDADGVVIPANTYLSAVVTFDRRLAVTVSSIEINGEIHSLRYEGYDTDGMRGLYCPGNTREDVRKDVGREVRQIGGSLLGSAVGSLASQVVGSGVSLIERSKGQQEMTIVAGYTFYLRKNTENQ